ncbi:MAG TPA: hypothetical protein VEO36_14810 [Casimicrobiaceae bacterium]|nr:hypothetical protein [Casimicrobiaceae bacterium]
MPTIRWPVPGSTLMVCLAIVLAGSWPHDASADKKNVCTITVNSADEKEAFRRSLPPDKFQFVELVERGRPDWLASACQRQIRCDVLVISGHYDGGNEFFSEHVDAHEFLPVDEMERASCSNSCSSLFSQLKEVYLFGCNTLNPERQNAVSADIARNLVLAGHSPADAERLARALSARYGDSSRDRMRQIFPNVPAIYGFSSVAPLGPTAAFNLSRYLQSGTGEVGSGHASSRLIGHFAGHSLTWTSGLNDSDPQANYRRDMCQFSGDQLSAAQKVAFVHQVLGREMAEVRIFLDRIERYMASLRDVDRETSAVSHELDAIAHDEGSRARYLDFARNADTPVVRARMLKAAHVLGWLTPTDLRAELMRTIADTLARSTVTPADVDLACTLNQDHALDDELHRLQLSPAQTDRAGSAAVLACLGSVESHARVLRALTSSSDDDVQVAQVYLRHRPIADANELRALTTGVARMTDAKAQSRALDTLAGQQITDRQSLEDLTRLFAQAGSGGVQLAIAGILLRSDYQMIASADLLQLLRQHRRKSSSSDDMVDVLIRRVQGLL